MTERDETLADFVREARRFAELTRDTAELIGRERITTHGPGGLQQRVLSMMPSPIPLGGKLRDLANALEVIGREAEIYLGHPVSPL